MPVPSTSRHSRTISPPFVTPVRPTQIRAPSTQTSSSYSPTITSAGNQTRLNVVTRVAIEGKAKQGQDGGSIRMYLKIALPLDSITPGSTIPLFPEENVKVLTSQVHPIDHNSVPYNFSSTVSPLLHNAARALKLPPRLPETFYSALNLTQSHVNSSVASSRVSKTDSNAEAVPPVDEQYTGHILVSGYNISYVLPKVFPARNRASSPSDDTESFSRSSYRSRRASIGEKNTAQFMAAIDMWVPFVSRPPRSPYLLSVPSPRCLHNHIKLRIFPPSSTSSSLASLSSLDEDGGGSWDLTSDPHVTRSASSRPSRSNSYTHFADDESSDSSTAGFSDGCGIQGTFPSAERIRVRWAKPMKVIDVPGASGDGRRRVGVKEVKGEMVCVVRGKMKDPDKSNVDGVLMNVEYKGTCKGVWYPGVATLLGMDVGLESKGSEVKWADNSRGQWEVNGGVGYTGFNVGPTSAPGLNSRTSSVDSNIPQLRVSPSDDNLMTRPNGQPSRSNSTSSMSSLLRAPLPVQNVAEYSFEGSTATLASSSSPIGTLSSISSFHDSSAPDVESSQIRPPGVPITLHVNMNELLPPAKHTFNFTITGTILVFPRTSLAHVNGRTSPRSSSAQFSLDHEAGDPEAFVLPRFTVLAADSESTSIVVRNEVEGFAATIEVYNSSGDIYRDAQVRKTVLQKGGFTKCGEDGGRIALKTIAPALPNGHNQRPPRSRTTSGGATSRRPSTTSPSLARPGTDLNQPRKGVPRIIPSVTATVTPLAQDDAILPDSYAVRVCLNAPADSDSEWLEFGLALPGSETSTSTSSGKPKVHIASASVDGVPVKYEATAVAKKSLDGASNYEVPFEDMSGKEWISWVKVQVGARGGENVVIDYVVDETVESTAVGTSLWKGKNKPKAKALLKIFLPTFSLPIGRLEVNVDPMSELNFASVRSNFTHQRAVGDGRRLLRYSLEGYFTPHLVLTISRKRTAGSFVSSSAGYFVLTWVVLLMGLFSLRGLSSDLKQLNHSLESYLSGLGSSWDDITGPVTITSTIYTSTSIGPRRWFGDISSELTSATPSPSVSITTVSSTSSSLGTHTLSPEPTVASQPLETKTVDASISLVSSSPVLEKYGLIPLQELFNFSWPIRDMDSIRATLEKVAETMETVWQLLRKAYHYPLDPP